MATGVRSSIRTTRRSGKDLWTETERTQGCPDRRRAITFDGTDQRMPDPFPRTIAHTSSRETFAHRFMSTVRTVKSGDRVSHEEAEANAAPVGPTANRPAAIHAIRRSRPRGGGGVPPRVLSFFRTDRPALLRFPGRVLWYARYSIIYFPSPASDRMAATRSSKDRPSNFAALGRRLVSVIPGIVFASRKMTFPAGSTR